MTLQWMAVAVFLYVEIGLCLLLILPLLRAKTWKWIFNLRVFSTISPVWSTLYYAILLILVVLFVDSIRTMVKYGQDPVDGTITLDAKLDRHLRECRGQRNFYITGFALFLILVLRRLITMLSQLAQLEASHEAALNQARAASRAADAEISRKSGKTDKGPDDSQPTKTKVPSAEQYKAMQDELKKTRADLDAMKKQAESTNREYDRLAEENQKLQNKLTRLEGQEEAKKDQ